MGMIILIYAAGDGTRWNDYLGVKKHFIPINGEPIIKRTIRLINKYAPKAEIIVVGPNQKYKFIGCGLYKPTKNKSIDNDIDKITNSMDLWSKGGRTILILGDVYFTDDAMRKIINYERHSTTFFARPYPSKITGHRYRENFAISFWPENQARLKQIISKCCVPYRTKFCKPGSWELYGRLISDDTAWQDSSSGIKKMFLLLQKFPFHHALEVLFAKSKGHLVVIDDWTDDFDEPSDLNGWLERWNERHRKLMELPRR
jgi:hypothetical protein